jgi:hypothetical protein
VGRDARPGRGVLELGWRDRFTQRIATGNPEWSKVRDKIDRSHREPNK